VPNLTNTRKENGQVLCQQVNRIDERTFSVNSQSGNGSYTVISSEIGWKCPCPDHAFRGVKCEHIWVCQLSTELHKKVEESVQVMIKRISD
jgi:hypothetical protein